MLTKKSLFILRPAIPDDENFILSTWLKALRFGNGPTICKICEKNGMVDGHQNPIRCRCIGIFELVPEDIYYKFYKQIIFALLASSTIMIAALKSDPTVVLAYSVYDGDVLHFVFCKEVWRSLGLAKDLIPKDLKIYTHTTKSGRALFNKYYPTAIFNPFWRKQ